MLVPICQRFVNPSLITDLWRSDTCDLHVQFVGADVPDCFHFSTAQEREAAIQRLVADSDELAGLRDQLDVIAEALVGIEQSLASLAPPATYVVTSRAPVPSPASPSALSVGAETALPAQPSHGKSEFAARLRAMIAQDHDE